MIVVDASVIAHVVGDDTRSGRALRARFAGEVDVAAPDLLDVETTSVLRKLWLRGSLSMDRFETAVRQLLDLPIVRVPAGQLMPRAVELGANLTPYDASYVALAERLGCSLLTADRGMGRAPGIGCSVELVELVER